jgi:hypothetical protein
MDADAPNLPLTGGCMCGATRYEIDAPLEAVGYCHCTRCQRRSGCSASISGRVAAGSFRVVRGEQNVEAYRPENGFEKAFCSACGSALFSRNPVEPHQIGVRLGTLDSDPGLRPSYRQFVAYAVPWEPVPDDGLERFPEGRST